MSIQICTDNIRVNMFLSTKYLILMIEMKGGGYEIIEDN